MRSVNGARRLPVAIHRASDMGFQKGISVTNLLDGPDASYVGLAGGAAVANSIRAGVTVIAPGMFSQAKLTTEQIGRIAVALRAASRMSRT